MKKLITSTSALIALALLLTGCGTKATPKATATPTPAPIASNPYGAAPIDPPGPNDVILTLAKGGKSISLTMNQIEAFKSSTITIYEPFVKVEQSFVTIPLSDLFNEVGIAPNDTVITEALNDYVYTNTAKKFLDAKGLLAIKRNGEPIPFDQGGPIRIIFPTGSVWSAFLDPWNWSLSSISVK